MNPRKVSTFAAISEPFIQSCQHHNRWLDLLDWHPFRPRLQCQLSAFLAFIFKQGRLDFIRQLNRSVGRGRKIVSLPLLTVVKKDEKKKDEKKKDEKKTPIFPVEKSMGVLFSFLLNIIKKSKPDPSFRLSDQPRQIRLFSSAHQTTLNIYYQLNGFTGNFYGLTVVSKTR